MAARKSYLHGGSYGEDNDYNKKASSSAPTLMHRAAVSGSPIDNAG